MGCPTCHKELFLLSLLLFLLHDKNSSSSKVTCTNAAEIVNIILAVKLLEILNVINIGLL